MVSPGSEIEITGDDSKIEVLLFSKDDKITIGTPLVDDCPVKTEVVFKVKGEKIRVMKFKAKSRLLRVMGILKQITKLKILSVGAEPTTPVVKKSPVVKKTKAKK